jgi:hypothetical protein
MYQPLLRVEWDLFHHDHLTDDVQFKPTAVSCSVGVSLSYDTSANQAGAWAFRSRITPLLRLALNSRICNFIRLNVVYTYIYCFYFFISLL